MATANIMTSTAIKLKSIIKQIHHCKMQTIKQNANDRRADTRKKIMLGGLFVKAGLDHYYPEDPATLFGMLLHAKQALALRPELAIKWQKLGKEIMLK